MRIFHIIVGLERGGAESVLFRLVTEDQRNTHYVVSLTNIGAYGERLSTSGIDVEVLNFPRGGVRLVGLLKLSKLIRTQSPNVVQTWMYHADLVGGLIARLCGIKQIVWGIRASNAYLFTNRRTRALLWVLARLSRILPRKIVCASSAGARHHELLGYAKGKIEVIANGYDTALLSPNVSAGAAVRRSKNINPNLTVIGMVARWDPLKDHDTLLASLRRLCFMNVAPWVCVLIGAGMSQKNLELCQLINRHGVPGKMHLWGPTENINEAMNALDIHVLSSKSESFPNVLPEAMACGIPCVTTDVGDAELIVGSTGWVVPRSNPEALALALKDAISESRNSKKWIARKSACREHIVRNYALETMIENYHRVWGSVANEK